MFRLFFSFRAVPVSRQFSSPSFSSTFTRMSSTSTASVKPSKKRLVVCCDGTWQSSNHGAFSVPSNIARLARSIATCDTSSGESVHQFVWYDAGVGTATDTVTWKKGDGLVETVSTKLASTFKTWSGFGGIGLDENICEAYGFLADNYNEGDEVFFFGFSRGAYTARAAAGLVAEVGVVRKDMMDGFPAMYNEYRNRATGTSIKDGVWSKSKKGADFIGACRPVKVKLVGVFDTVGALGIPRNAIVSSETTASVNQKYEFHNTALSDKVEYAFHALALSEHRESFGPTLWTLDEPMHAKPGTAEGTDLNQKTKMAQVWFPGVHINCGGGCGDGIDHDTGEPKLESKREADNEAMATLTFAWMVDRVAENTDLKFDEDALEKILATFVQNTKDLSGRKTGLYRGWGVGPISDKDYEGFKKAGSETRTPGAYRTPDAANVLLGRTNEWIHPVVKYAGYGDAASPEGVVFPFEALKAFKRSEDKSANARGAYTWKKEAKPVVKGWLGSSVGSKPAEDAAEIPEWKMPELIKGKVGMERRVLEADLERDSEHEVDRGIVQKLREYKREVVDKLVSKL